MKVRIKTTCSLKLFQLVDFCVTVVPVSHWSAQLDFKVKFLALPFCMRNSISNYVISEREYAHNCFTTQLPTYGDQTSQVAQ